MANPLQGTGGYILLSRRLLEHPLTSQLPAAWFRIFIVILLRVNWKPGVWWNGSQNIDIPAGSMITSVEKLSKMAKVSTKQVRGCLQYLQTANIAAIKTASQYTLITVLNWATYQNPAEYEGKPNCESEGNQRANQGQSEGKPGATIEEGNKGTREERKKQTLGDGSSDSRKNRANDRSECREILRHQLLSWGIQPEPPDDDILNAIIEAGARYGATVDEIAAVINEKSIYANPERKRTRPREYEWFITVVATEFRTRRERELNSADLHGNTSAENDLMTGSFDTSDDFVRPAASEVLIRGEERRAS